MLMLLVEYKDIELNEKEKNLISIGKLFEATSSHYRRLKHLEVSLKYSHEVCSEYYSQLN